MHRGNTSLTSLPDYLQPIQSYFFNRIIYSVNPTSILPKLNTLTICLISCHPTLISGCFSRVFLQLGGAYKQEYSIDKPFLIAKRLIDSGEIENLKNVGKGVYPLLGKMFYSTICGSKTEYTSLSILLWRRR